MRKLAIGYLLCMANSSVFVSLGQTLYLALATYPVSMIFRTIGWRELGKTDRLARGVAFAVGVLGALTYLLIIGALIIGGDQGGPKLAYAAVPRTVYSFEEAHYT